MRVTPSVVGGALLAALAVSPQPSIAQGLMLSGYADLEVNLDKLGSDNSEFYLDNHHFNLIALGKLVENVFAAAEIEFEHAGEEIAFEYGYISYTGLRNLRVQAGKFIVPFGRFNKDLHPTWINKMPDRPNGFANVFPQTYSDVGVWLSGGAPLGTAGARLAFDAFVVNGLMGDDGGDIRDMRDNDRDKATGGRDDSKALGGRLGVELAPQGFDIGASGYFGNYVNVADSSLTLAMFGVDASYHNRGLEIRAEGVLADQEATGGSLSKKGGYAQVAYLIQAKYEPVIRFSMRDMPGEDSDRSRISFGANYYVSASSAIRLAYHVNIEKSGFESDNNKLVAQYTMSF
ncbi:MAG: porin [Gemmatimonadales bacterium]